MEIKKDEKPKKTEAEKPDRAAVIPSGGVFAIKDDFIGVFKTIKKHKEAKTKKPGK